MSPRRLLLPLLPFFALAFGFSWAVWWPLLAPGHPAPAALHLWGSLGPAAAAIITAAALDRPSLRPLGQALGRWRVGWGPWAFAVGAPAALLGLGVALSAGAGQPWPGWAGLLRVAEYPHLGPLALLLAEVVFYGYGEEVGWRGFALPRLLPVFGPVWAPVWLSVPWALWHLPLLLRNETFTAMSLAALLGWYASLLMGALLMTWLWRWAQGSLLVLAAFHGLLDVAMVNETVTPLALNAMGAVVTVWGLLALRALRRPQARRCPAPPQGR
ncbi:CPBP family intramembrane glutamic endopeptidase [Deinococcus multiflagellatus]|uniref:CPBP family intramembrane glutamic endopeptidase n=1 Tax=Deinococcus multiflagellatus TaxID=1656887 RepID=A0ABW1ZSM9_9DEIO|nr:CPBP family intramembrane glutamic endopeptidase [Deinococcus multiflagellatus]MBZ9713583.1 CPBP family intramembrane metalloprotease [Deinococcus multiflagellatus]